jgi:hypothetical protein
MSTDAPALLSAIVICSMYVSVSLSAPAPNRWTSPRIPPQLNVFPAPACASESGMLTLTPPLNMTESGIASGMFEGQTEFGKLFLYSS